jgi:hypothetical protein
MNAANLNRALAGCDVAVGDYRHPTTDRRQGFNDDTISSSSVSIA